ncbi:MAG: TatD family hydrolase, partial [Pelagibacterales bacterium]|nr:TatD family hydrolase [Pelagibacterales bacterium]
SKRDIQIESLYKHIEVSKETNLPLIIHARDADDDIIEILTNEYKKKKFTGVIHCFTSSQKLADAALSIGFYISFSGIITFKNAENIRKACEIIPINKILIETDAPFLAPIPFRGKRNEPAYIIETLKKVSEIKNIPLNTTKNITTDNFFNLFTRAKL